MMASFDSQNFRDKKDETGSHRDTEGTEKTVYFSLGDFSGERRLKTVISRKSLGFHRQ
jgi:hypothetical protein